MKLKVFILFTLLISSSHSLVSANEVELKYINYVELELVLDNVYQASFELDSYFKVTIEEVNPDQAMTCVPVNAAELKMIIWQQVKKFRNHYPDEELPFVKAKKQLEQIIGSSPYENCETITDKDSYEIVVQTYISSHSPFSFILEFEREN
jgi:hypothetical protein